MWPAWWRCRSPSRRWAAFGQACQAPLREWTLPGGREKLCRFIFKENRFSTIGQSHLRLIWWRRLEKQGLMMEDTLPWIISHSTHALTATLQVCTCTHGASLYRNLDPSCNKCCDLIGHTRVSILHRKPCTSVENLVKLCRKPCNSYRKPCNFMSKGTKYHAASESCDKLQAWLLGSKHVRHCLVGFHVI